MFFSYHKKIKNQQFTEDGSLLEFSLITLRRKIDTIFPLGKKATIVGILPRLEFEKLEIIVEIVGVRPLQYYSFITLPIIYSIGTKP